MSRILRGANHEHPVVPGFYWWRMPAGDGSGWTKGEVVWVGQYAGIGGLGQILSGQIADVRYMMISEWIGPIPIPDWENSERGLTDKEKELLNSGQKNVAFNMIKGRLDLSNGEIFALIKEALK